MRYKPVTASRLGGGVKTLAFTGLLALLAGCASMLSVSDNEACVIKLNIPDQLTNCVGAYDVVFNYRNPPRPKGELLFHELYNPRIALNYFSQEGANHCYAAALVSGFSVLGTTYSQAQFSKAISQECFVASDAPLTFSQIVFAATRVHAPPGMWYIAPSISTRMNAIADIMAQTTSSSVMPVQSSRVFKKTVVVEQFGRCQDSNGANKQYWLHWDPLSYWTKNKLSDQQGSLTPSVPSVPSVPPVPPVPPIPPIQHMPDMRDMPDFNPPAVFEQVSRQDLYAPVTWHFKDQPPGTVNGAIIPIRDSGHLIDAFYSGMPIIAGLVNGLSGHVVLVNRIYITVIDAGNNTVVRHPSGYIEWVEVADPENREYALRIIPGDSFLSSAHFIFAIYQEIRK